MISVVIPYRTFDDRLKQALAVLKQSAVENEILLVQNDAEIGKAYNTGIDRARGEIIAFLDADCIPSPHWLSAIRSTFKWVNIHTIGIYGKTLSPPRQFDYFEHAVHSSAEGLVNFPGGNMAWRSEYAKQVQFDFRFTQPTYQDTDFGLRMFATYRRVRINGARLGVMFVPEMRVFHPTVLLDFKKIRHRAFMFGAGWKMFRQFKGLAQHKAHPLPRKNLAGFLLSLIFPFSLLVLVAMIWKRKWKIPYHPMKAALLITTKFVFTMIEYVKARWGRLVYP